MRRENGLLNFLIFTYFYVIQNKIIYRDIPGFPREIWDSGNGIPGNSCSGICPTLEDIPLLNTVGNIWYRVNVYQNIIVITIFPSRVFAAFELCFRFDQQKKNAVSTKCLPGGLLSLACFSIWRCHLLAWAFDLCLIYCSTRSSKVDTPPRFKQFVN